MKLKVMTYNICSTRNFMHEMAYELGACGRVMQAYGADIIGVNEVRGLGPDPDFTPQAEHLASFLGYHGYFARAIWLHGTCPYGNALLSRYPFLKAETVPIPDPEDKSAPGYYETRCVLKALLDVPGIPGGLNVLVSHFGLVDSEKRNAVDTVLRLVRETEGPLLFMGDLNMQPDDPILQPLFEVLEDTAKKAPAGIVTHPSDGLLNYNKETAEREGKPVKQTRNVKIDYIFTKNGFETLCADVLYENASDHRPYAAELEF